MSLLNLIDEALAKKQAEREARTPSGFISPSSLGRCYRAQYWQRKGEPKSEPLDSRTLRVFACGNLFHDFVQQFIHNAQVEVDVQKDDIRGRADVVDDDCVYDIKSMHSKGFFYLKNCDITKEKETAWLQVACYASILQKPKISLVIISKDDLSINEYVDHTEKWIEKLDKELTTIRYWWDKKELPEAEAKAYGGKECKYCNYLTKCKTIGGKQWNKKEV